jgi:hypothetical protein
MNDPLDAILEDLYAIDPSLRSQDGELRRLARELLAAKPGAPLDQAFVARLRSELMLKAESVRRRGFFAGLLRGNRAALAIPVLVILALAVVGRATLLPHGGIPRSAQTVALSSAADRLGPSAFGHLSAGASPVREGAPNAAPAPQMAVGAVPPSTTSPMPPGAGGAAVGKMLMPVDWTPTTYKFVYKGEAIEGLTDSVDVFRRITAPAGSGPIDALKGFNLGLIDLGKLNAASVQSFTIAEGGDDGYVVTVSPEEGTITVSENANWNYPERRCQDQACIDRYRLKASDMPKDDAVTRAADAFLDGLGVSRQGYGDPVVRADWRESYRLASDKAGFWFPDTEMVVYPYLVDGKPAVDESGAPYGLDVNVNVAHLRASSLWNLTVPKFESSPYAAESDPAALIKVAEKGGAYAGGVMENAKVVEVSLGTPTIAYSRFWQADDKGGAELFVPTLVFPVLDAPPDLYQTSVSVPLAKDLLQAGMSAPGGVAVPMKY